MRLLKFVPVLHRSFVLRDRILRSSCHCYNLKFYSNSPKYDLDLNINGISLQNYIKQLENEYETIKNNTSYQSKTRLLELQPLINILNARKSVIDNISNLAELLNEKDDEIKKLANEEKAAFEDKIKTIDSELFEAILPTDKQDLCDSMVLEVNTGVGGQEAMLFAKELFDMYCNFAEFKGWQLVIADYDATDLGGIRHASALITGNDAFRCFKHEAGVHRVQRIPATEKGGRIHTSTVSVLALPQPTDIQIKIESKDLKIETKRASGAGGQHVNTTDSAVRIVHLPTGLSVECQVDRSQIKNRQIALAKLRALLYQRELDSQISESLAARKSQVKSSFRNEKIRTYNYPQDRITDHRLQGGSVHNLKGFLAGGQELEELINKLDIQCRIENLLFAVNQSSNK